MTCHHLLRSPQHLLSLSRLSPAPCSGSHVSASLSATCRAGIGRSRLWSGTPLFTDERSEFPHRRHRCSIVRAAAAAGGDDDVSASSASSGDSQRPHSAIREIQRQLANGERTAVGVAEEYLERLEAHEGQLRSFLHTDREAVLQQAREVDATLASQSGSGEKTLGLLTGVPIGVKDNLCTRGMPSTAASKILKGYMPPYDATSVARVKAEGAVVVGKTNMDEFGMGSTTEGSGYQVTANPWDLSRVPGGSSGGSAAAVAAGQCAVALGSDTGGSVRQPASFCGIVGLKPSYGRVSRLGLMAYASSLDCVGVLARSVEDTAIVLQAMAGRDDGDSTSGHEPIPDYTAALLPRASLASKPLTGVRLALVQETMGAGVDADVALAVRAAARHYETLGATVEEVSMPFFANGLPAYYILAPSEASSNLSRYDGIRFGPQHEGTDLTSLYSNTRGQGFGKEVKRRILMGTYALSSGYYDAYYKKAQQVRTMIRKEFVAALEGHDALLTPTAPTTAYRIGEKTSDPLAMYVGDLMTVNVNLAGLPAISLPCGLAPGGPHGLPIGLQIIGAPFAEADILKYAHVFEQTTPAWQSGLAIASPVTAAAST
ncbi:hypothetical protein CLOM_g14819 [Closterium sp. NIES-68]|nr:hypothetical protein CLOM_g14819 [Closterium sp. NIES-68]